MPPAKPQQDSRFSRRLVGKPAVNVGKYISEDGEWTESEQKADLCVEDRPLRGEW